MRLLRIVRFLRFLSASDVLSIAVDLTGFLASELDIGVNKALFLSRYLMEPCLRTWFPVAVLDDMDTSDALDCWLDWFLSFLV